MTWKPAFIRAFRTFLQGCAATLGAFTLWLGTQSALNWGDIKIEGSKVVLGLLMSLSVGLVSLIHNLLELNSGVGKKIPRG